MLFMYAPAYAVSALRLAPGALPLPAEPPGWTFAMGRSFLGMSPNLYTWHRLRSQWHQTVGARVLLPFARAGDPGDLVKVFSWITLLTFVWSWRLSCSGYHYWFLGFVVVVFKKPKWYCFLFLCSLIILNLALFSRLWTSWSSRRHLCTWRGGWK